MSSSERLVGILFFGFLLLASVDAVLDLNLLWWKSASAARVISFAVACLLVGMTFTAIFMPQKLFAREETEKSSIDVEQ